MKRIIFLVLFFVSSTFWLNAQDDTKTSERSRLVSSIGDYSEHLLNSLAEECWWRDHPHKKHRRSDFHHYNERLRRKSAPSSLDKKNNKIVFFFKRSSYFSSEE